MSCTRSISPAFRPAVFGLGMLLVVASLAVVSQTALAEAVGMGFGGQNPTGEVAWTDQVPLYPSIKVAEIGRTRDGAGFYMQGTISSDLRNVAVYYDRELGNAGWQPGLFERAPGGVLHLTYTRGEEVVAIALSLLDDGALVLMAYGPFHDEKSQILDKFIK